MRHLFLVCVLFLLAKFLPTPVTFFISISFVHIATQRIPNEPNGLLRPARGSPASEQMAYGKLCVQGSIYNVRRPARNPQLHIQLSRAAHEICNPSFRKITISRDATENNH